MPEDINEAIEQNALGPRRVQVANESVEQHSIADQIKARDDVAGQTAKLRPAFGLRIRKIEKHYR